MDFTPKFNKLEAIQYLFDHSVYGNEWQGTGMWEAVIYIMGKVDNYIFSKSDLDKLLKQAEER